MKNYLIFICLLVFGCTESETPTLRRLQAWDRILNESPKAVRDSLQTLRPEQLNRGEQAYYALLDAESSNKTAVALKNDSALRIAESYFKGSEAYGLLARTQLYIGQIQHRNLQDETAFGVLKEAESHLRQNGAKDPRTLALIYYWLGQIHLQQDNFDEASAYSDKAAGVYAELKDTLQMVAVLNSAISIHSGNQQFTKAKLLLDSCSRLLAAMDQRTYRLAHIQFGVLYSYALWFEAQNQLDSALHYNSVCISLAEENHIPPASLYPLQSSLLYKLGRYDECRSYNLKSLEQAEKEQDLVRAAAACRFLFFAAEKQGEFEKACSYREQYNQLKDKLIVTRDNDALVELERKYNLAEKEKELLEWKNQLLWLLAILLGTVCCLSATSLIVLRKKRTLQEKHDLLAEKVIRTQWGYALSRRVISYNFNAFEEVEKLIARHAQEITDDFLQDFKRFSKKQKEAYFKELYDVIRKVDQHFTDTLKQLFPELPEEEAMLAFLIREEWELNDIANILDISYEAAKKRRYRLRVKLMGATEKDANLAEFLKEFSDQANLSSPKSPIQ